MMLRGFIPFFVGALQGRRAAVGAPLPRIFLSWAKLWVSLGR